MSPRYLDESLLLRLAPNHNYCVQPILQIISYKIPNQVARTSLTDVLRGFIYLENPTYHICTSRVIPKISILGMTVQITKSYCLNILFYIEIMDS